MPLDVKVNDPDEPVIIEDEDEGVDAPEYDDDGNLIRIDHPDGSITISLNGKMKEPDKDENEGWYANLAEDIEDGELSRISDDIIRGVEHDMMSRQEWVDNLAEGMKLLGLRVDVPGVTGGVDGAPVEGMSKVRHPLLLEACLGFQANARGELLPTDGPVKVRDDNNYSTPEDAEIADALEKDLNHYLTVTATEYYPDTDRMLFMFAFSGIGIKKVYFCPLRNRPLSERIDVEDFIVNNLASDIENAHRATHRIRMRPSVVKRMQIIGAYRDVELSQPAPIKTDAAQEARHQIQGVSSGNEYAEDRDREIYECYTELEIDGYEHKKNGKITGLPVPYRVTIDVSSRQILSIVRNFAEDTASLPVKNKTFVKYEMIPGLGFYPIGFLNILGNTTNALTATWRELLDAGMYANFPGFLYAKGAGRQNSNIFRVPPGGGAPIDTQGMPITQSVMPLPYSAGSMGPLMQHSENISTYAQRLGGTAQMPTGEGRADAPVGTTLALIEQQSKVLNSIHKRMHSAQAEEFQLLRECFKNNPDSFWQTNRRPAYPWDQEVFLKALENNNIVPQADPNTSSHLQRMAKTAALIELVGTNPPLFDLPAVARQALKSYGWSNPDQFMSQNDEEQPDPQAEAQTALAQAAGKEADAKMLLAQAKVEEMQRGPGPEVAAKDQINLQIKGLDADLKRQELQQKGADAQLDASNRKRDRESRERLSAVNMAINLAKNPAGIGIVNSVIRPGMLDNLENNERPIDPTPGALVE